jgi:phosphatidylglycerophosphatase A
MNTEINASLPPKPNLKWMLGTMNRTIAFGFGSGLSTKAPGTVGTLWAWAIFLGAHYFLSTANWLWVIAAGILLGSWVCGQVSEELGKSDFGGIVWDEMLAFWLILVLIPNGLWLQVIAFVLFRFFDVIKPGPIGIIDRHFKKLEHNNSTPSSKEIVLWRGFGIIADDLAAAFCTLLVIALGQILFTQFQ